MSKSLRALAIISCTSMPVAALAQDTVETCAVGSQPNYSATPAPANSPIKVGKYDGTYNFGRPVVIYVEEVAPAGGKWQIRLRYMQDAWADQQGNCSVRGVKVDSLSDFTFGAVTLTLNGDAYIARHARGGVATMKLTAPNR